MRCPKCKNLDSRVLDSRLIEEGLCIRRRRECRNCSLRFTTYERLEGLTLMVIKKNRRREPFDRAKILNGVKRACNKRGISSEAIEALVDKVEQQVRDISHSEIQSELVGRLVMDKLQKMDEVAYLRFASVYKKFDEASSFLDEIRSLKNKETVKN